MVGLNLDSRVARTAAAGLRIIVLSLGIVAGPFWSMPSVADADSATLAALNAAAHVDPLGRLQMDVHFNCSLEPPNGELAAAGLSVTSSVKAGTLCVVEGWALRGAVAHLLAVPGVTQITAPSYPIRTPPAPPRPADHVGVTTVRKASATSALTIDQYGISIMRVDQFVAQTGGTGAGVTIGVQSSGISSISTIQGRGELPNVQVLYPAGTTSSSVQADEGTALLEEVHAVAPSAKLVYCEPTTFVDFTSCLTQFVSAGATIALDDIAFASDGLLSLSNDQSSAITQFLAANPTVMMFTSAGNNQGTYWEGTYQPVSASTPTLPSLPTLACPSGAAKSDAYVATIGTGYSETLNVAQTTAFPLLLAWADPPGQITSQFDVYWFATGSTTPLGCFSTAGTTSNQYIQYLSLSTGNYTLVIATPDASASGKFLKLWAGGDGLTSLSVATSGGLISPQHMVSGVVTVGAVNGSDGIGTMIEPFSSSGPLTVEFPTLQQLQPEPLLVAPDGITIDATGTYFSDDLFPDGNFYGTSASVTNAAAVAALLRGAFPTLTVAQTTGLLETGATPLGTPLPNNTFGYGRVDALGALNALAAPKISNLVNQSSTGSASTPAQAFTLAGTGTLKFTVSSSNAALVPGTIASTGSPGVTLSSGCGTTSLTCTLSVQPVIGQAGTAVLTVTVTDGANRGASAQLTVTATDPATSTVMVSSPPATTPVATSSGGTAASSNGGGGALQVWALICLGALVARRRGVDRNLN